MLGKVQDIISKIIKFIMFLLVLGGAIVAFLYLRGFFTSSPDNNVVENTIVTPEPPKKEDPLPPPIIEDEVLESDDNFRIVDLEVEDTVVQGLERKAVTGKLEKISEIDVDLVFVTIVFEKTVLGDERECNLDNRVDLVKPDAPNNYPPMEFEEKREVSYYPTLAGLRACQVDKLSVLIRYREIGTNKITNSVLARLYRGQDWEL